MTAHFPIVSRLFPLLCLTGVCLAGPVVQTDFEPGSAAPPLTTTVSGAAATADIAAVGTIDVYGSTAPSAALRLSVKANAPSGRWTAAAVAGPWSFESPERDLRKLTLSFMASVSTLQPVDVRIDSLDATGHVTGSAATEVYPAAPNFYQRYAAELSSLKAVGDKTFDPAAPQLRVSFGLKSEPGLAAADHYELRVDNVALSAPSFYVSPGGDDSAAGTTEATALRTPQKAVERAGPGDVILLKGGEYQGRGDSVHFPRPGQPAGWIVLKNAPGETPVLKSNGWSVVRIGLGTKEAPDQGPGIAYIEVRGLHLIGTSFIDASGQSASPYPELLGKVVAETNSNGLIIEARNSKNVVHHIRVADCVISRNAGVGLGAIFTDWGYFENNVLTDNSWFTNYATSGFSILLGASFDGTAGGYRFLVSGNRSSGNRCYQKWTASSIVNGAPKKLSDGNGFIIDTLGGSAVTKGETHPPFNGRTLVVNNVSFNNGGSGIHLVSSPNVDLVNNTTYLNGQTPETKYGQMFSYRSPGSNFVNNILVAPEGQEYNKSSPYGEAGNTDVVWSHNLFFGSKAAVRPGGIADLTADPLFANASKDREVASFVLRPGSPALSAGTRATAVPIPLVDIDGNRRPLDRNPSIGASQP